MLSSKLREHQAVGVRFLWRCITEQAAAEGADGGAALPEGLRCAGCILADEMGLGAQRSSPRPDRAGFR